MRLNPVLCELVHNIENINSSIPHYLSFKASFEDKKSKLQIINDMAVIEDFITEDEEALLLEELDPYMKRLRYEANHWDNAIEGYRETEKMHWRSENSKIIDRVKTFAFRQDTHPLKYVHVLDLQDKGVIKPHIDSVRFCGSTIAGISLISDSVMRLQHDKDKEKVVDILLKRRSLYIMTGAARYDYTHEILGNQESKFDEKLVEKTRRISVICRNEP